jgi:hypothetical protein
MMVHFLSGFETRDEVSLASFGIELPVDVRLRVLYQK